MSADRGSAITYKKSLCPRIPFTIFSICSRLFAPLSWDIIWLEPCLFTALSKRVMNSENGTDVSKVTSWAENFVVVFFMDVGLKGMNKSVHITPLGQIYASYVSTSEGTWPSKLVTTIITDGRRRMALSFFKSGYLPTNSS